jgi:hypothetical protein
MTVRTRGSEVAGRWPAWRWTRAIAAARRRIVEDRKPSSGQRGQIQGDHSGRGGQRLELVALAPGLELLPVAGVRAGRADRLRGRGVPLGVVDQLGELGGQVRGQLGRQAVERAVEREHRLGVEARVSIGSEEWRRAWRRESHGC